MSLPLLLLTLGGCDAVTSLLHPPEAPTVAPAAPVAPPQKDLAAKLEDARGQLRAGKAKEALGAAEALLAAHPEDDAVWEFVELAALRGAAAGELVDRLSADQAIGGRVDKHHALRGVLAVEANRLGDALNAARALATVAPGDAAAIVALAVARGAPAPEGLGAGASALVALADPTKPVEPAAEALPGWRAALVRAEARLARGDRAGALLDAATAETGGVRARAGAARVRIRAAAQAEEAWAAAEPAARAVLEAGDAVGAAELLDEVAPRAFGAWKAATVADLAAELRGPLTEAGNVDAATRLAVIEGEAALRAGAPLRARSAAKAAAEGPATQVRAAWVLALAGAALGEPGSVEEAAARLSEPRAGAARDLARALRGHRPTLPSEGLDGPDAALQALLGAGWLPDPAPACAAAAARAGEDAPDLRLWASLAGDRGPLEEAPADAPESEALRAERALRSWLADGSAPTLGGGLDHPGLSGWTALLGGAPAAADAPGVAAWARARAALAAADAEGAARELGALANDRAAWRTGPWAPLLVLDGPKPSELEADAAANRRIPDPIPFAVAHHGWAARVGSTETAWRHGIAPFAPTATAEQRAAVWDAVAGLRAGELAWLAGVGPWPAAAQAALVTAEKAAGLEAFPPPPVATLRSALEGSAVISFRPALGGVETLYLAEEKGRLDLLPASIARDVAAHLQDLRLGQSAIASGDRLRARVLDPAMDVLLGVGRYVVVGPDALGLLAIPALPEQADGLRFLASIRHVAHLPDLDAVLPPPKREAEASFLVLALCADPVEADAVRRVFPEARILEGNEATAAAYRERAPGVRYLHVGGFPRAADGGWVLSDGVLSLADIAAIPLGATGVVVQGGEDAESIVARMTALRRAGATDVLVEGWGATPPLRETMLHHVWEGLGRRFTASRSLTEARTLGIREIGDPVREPGNWAGYFAAGRP